MKYYLSILAFVLLTSGLLGQNAIQESEHIYRERISIDGAEAGAATVKPADLQDSPNADYWQNNSNVLGELKALRQEVTYLRTIVLWIVGLILVHLTQQGWKV
jgi:hypothetical protein